MSLDDLFDPQLYPQFDAPDVSGIDTTHDNIMVNEVMIHATEDEEEEEAEIPMSHDMYDTLSPLEINTPAAIAVDDSHHYNTTTVTPNNTNSEGQMSLDAHFATSSRTPMSPLTPPPVDVTPPPAPPSAPIAPITPGRGGVCANKTESLLFLFNPPTSYPIVSLCLVISFLTLSGFFQQSKHIYSLIHIHTTNLRKVLLSYQQSTNITIPI